jgi:hypothetical protein
LQPSALGKTLFIEVQRSTIINSSNPLTFIFSDKQIKQNMGKKKLTIEVERLYLVYSLFCLDKSVICIYMIWILRCIIEVQFIVSDVREMLIIRMNYSIIFFVKKLFYNFNVSIFNYICLD